MTRAVGPVGGKARFVALWSKNWYRFLSFFVPFVFDLAIGSLIFLALLWFQWLFGLGAAVGLKRDYIEGFAAVHYWCNYAVFVMLGLDFILRVLLQMFRGE